MNILCTEKLRYHDNIIACLEASMFGIHRVRELVKSNVQFINRCIGDHWDHLGHRGLWPAVGNAVDDPFELFLVGIILLQPIPKVHLCGGLGPANSGMIRLQWFHAIFTPRPVLAIRCCEQNGLRWGPVWNNSKWHLAVRPASHQKFPPLPLFWFQPLKERKLKCRFGPKHPVKLQTWTFHMWNRDFPSGIHSRQSNSQTSKLAGWRLEAIGFPIS